MVSMLARLRIFLEKPAGTLDAVQIEPESLPSPLISIPPDFSMLRAVIVLFGWLLLAVPTCAGEIQLKSGLVFEGKVAAVTDIAVFAINPVANAKRPNGCPIWLVDDGPRRLCVPGRQVVKVEPKEELDTGTVIRFKQIRTGQSIGPTSIQGFSRVEEFDEHGHGMVQLRTSKGPEDIYLGISELRPDYFTVQGLSHDWTFARTTQSLPIETLDRILRLKLDPQKAEDRKTLIKFYEQAGRFSTARQEAQQYSIDFPTEKEWCDILLSHMDELDAQRILHELQRRQIAGQHQLVEQMAQAFLKEEAVSAGVQGQVREIVQQYQSARERRATLFMQLDMLQADLPMELAMQLKPLRSLMEEELHAVENIARVEAFEQFAEADDLTAEQKLARAYSSWVVGPAHATESLPAAIRMWDLRFLMLEYQRTADSLRRAEIVKKIEETEDFSVELLAAMVELLPVFEESDSIPGGVPTTVEAIDAAGEPLSYSIVLPKEYNRAHTYPLLVALHDSGKTPEYEARWWAGDAEREGQGQRRGFITIAPSYTKPNQRGHEYDQAAHQAVLGAIRHAMRTCRVDANRVVLVGHGMGGDACFDIGMAHPDLFAGVAPICGKSTNYCKFYYSNGLDMSWYVVDGQLDLERVSENQRDLNRYFHKGIDIIYCEYKQRGYEGYSEELPRLMDWAETVRRKPLREFMEFEAKTLRGFDNRFHWIQVGAFRPELVQPIVWTGEKKPKSALTISGKITSPGGTVYVSHPGVAVSIWLSPEMFAPEASPFDGRIRVHVNKSQEFNGPVKPSAAALLDDLLSRADRQRVFWARLDLN